MEEYTQQEICARIAALRREVAGPRGKTNFAKQLGLSPSTYDYYEADRVPPAEVLVRIADAAGVDLRWLITGQSPAQPVAASHPAITRAAALLASHPSAAQPLAAFVELLAGSMAFPAKTDAAAHAGEALHEGVLASAVVSAPEISAPPVGLGAHAGAESSAPIRGRESWIPVLGRTAAGVPQFWAGQSAQGVTQLEDLVARHAGPIMQRPVRVEPADSPMPTGLASPLADDVQLIRLGQPDGEVAEFIASGLLKARYRDAFALRIDGQSMQPDILHGDLVLLSPSVPAMDGRAAVVQLKDQIGVTCKLFRHDADQVHLIPLNEQLPPQTFPAKEVVWSLKVLGKVRPAAR